MRIWSSSMTVFVLAITISSTALGLVPQGAPAAADLVAVPPFTVSAERVDSAALAEAQSRLDGFCRATGTHWQATSWAPVSLTPGLATGTGLNLGSPIPDRTAAVQAAQDFVTVHPDLFRTDEIRLSEPRVRFGLGKWSVSWQEQIAGMPILHSRVTILLTESGRLAAFGSSTYPSITQAPPPTLSPAEARRLAREHLADRGLIPRSAELKKENVRGPFVLPVSADAHDADDAGILAPAQVVGRTILRVALVRATPRVAYDVDVDAVTGEILQWTNVLRQDYNGTADATLDDLTWCAGLSEHPVPNLLVTVTDAGSGVTGPDGSFLIPSQNADPETLTAAMVGPFVHVHNLEGSGAFLQEVIAPDVPISLHWDDSNSRLEERDAFCFANRTHDFIQTCDPTWNDMDFPLCVEVNYADGCNGFYGDSTITLFHEEGNCVNTARLADVVAHEYAHGVTEIMYGEDYPRLDMHEGNSDVTANFLVNNPELAVGFYLDDCINGIRTSDNDFRWPEDLDGEGHHDGQIIAGFHWHSREALIEELGYDAGAATALTIWHFARSLGLPHNQPEQVVWSFLADDDDGDMDNGTPHYAALAEAAERHGFSYPEKFENVVIHHTRLCCAPGAGGEPIPLDAVLYSFAGPLNADSLLVFYRPLGLGAFASVSLQPSGEQDHYQALLPGGWTSGQEVQYWILAVDAEGNRLRRPATGEYDFVVGLACDDFEGETEWTVGAPGDSGPWSGKWALCDPVGILSATWGWIHPEEDATPDPGHLCWVTGEEQDADGRTSLVSPIYDLTGMTWASIRYNRWFQTLIHEAGALEIWVNYDGGESWNVLERTEGRQDPPSWTPRMIELQPPDGGFGPTRFRVVMFGQLVDSWDEGGFDDFVLLAGDQDPAAAEQPTAGVPTQLALRLRTANPAIDLAAFECAVPQAGPVRLELYEIDGSLVRVLVDRNMTSGLHEVVWDGKDNAGRRAAAGVYFARISSSSGSQTQRVLVAR